MGKEGCGSCDDAALPWDKWPERGYFTPIYNRMKKKKAKNKNLNKLLPVPYKNNYKKKGSLQVYLN